MTSNDMAFLRLCVDGAKAIDASLAACRTQAEERRWWVREGIDQDSLAQAMRDPVCATAIQSVARRAMCKLLFHLLVSFDEGRDIDERGTSVRVVYYEGDVMHRATSELHERLGDVMMELGLECEDWWP